MFTQGHMVVLLRMIRPLEDLLCTCAYPLFTNIIQSIVIYPKLQLSLMAILSSMGTKNLFTKPA